MINFILWIIVGGFVGWLASLIMNTHQGVLLDIIVGIVGAFVAGLVITPWFGGSTINDGISLASVVFSLLGAIVLLAVIKIVRRAMVR